MTWLFVMNEHRRLTGAIHLVDLLRAEPGVQVGAVAGPARRVNVRSRYGRDRPADD